VPLNVGKDSRGFVDGFRTRHVYTLPYSQELHCVMTFENLGKFNT